MLRETGFCSGIENYSKYLSGSTMERPYCLFDFFPKDYLLFVDESHVTLPQFRGMYNGDHSRKLILLTLGLDFLQRLKTDLLNMMNLKH